MGFFERFKSKKKELTLEQLLKNAAQEPSYRAAFYKKIVREALIVITENSNLPNGAQILKEDTNVNIVSFKDGSIPVFTTTDRIFDKNVVDKEVQFLQIKGLNLFEITKGATLILNPYSDYGKELIPEEIEKIMDGTIITQNHQQLKVKQDTKVIMGQPSIYPTEIINSLKILFSNRPTVRKAYLGWIHDPKSGENPHYIFGIDADGDFQDLINEAGFTVKEFLSKTEFVDFIKIDRKEKFSRYFLESVAPFYSK